MDSSFKLINDINNLNDKWYNEFGYRLVIGKRNTLDLLKELYDCIISCLGCKLDSSYIKMVYKDYEEYFNVNVDELLPDESKELLFAIIEESYRVDYDYIKLYKRGVDLITLDILSIDLVGNDNNLGILKLM